MTSPFGKITPSYGGEFPSAPTAPVVPAATPPAPVGHMASPHGIDGIGAYLEALLLPGEHPLASISLKEGDITLTGTRILVQRRELGLFGLSVNARATYSIRRKESVSTALASVTDVGRQIMGALFLLAGVGALASMSEGGSNAATMGGVIGVVFLLVALALFLSAKKAALVVDAGSSRVTIVVGRAERSRADTFFRQLAASQVG